ncbi:hypothetical protein DERP_006822, partial [Dermatophagoides pteronyssinus]
ITKTIILPLFYEHYLNTIYYLGWMAILQQQQQPYIIMYLNDRKKKKDKFKIRCCCCRTPILAKELLSKRNILAPLNDSNFNRCSAIPIRCNHS